jgi:hypothetical protein
MIDWILSRLCVVASKLGFFVFGLSVEEIEKIEDAYLEWRRSFHYLKKFVSKAQFDAIESEIKKEGIRFAGFDKFMKVFEDLVRRMDNFYVAFEEFVDEPTLEKTANVNKAFSEAREAFSYFVKEFGEAFRIIEEMVDSPEVVLSDALYQLNRLFQTKTIRRGLPRGWRATDFISFFIKDKKVLLSFLRYKYKGKDLYTWLRESVSKGVWLPEFEEGLHDWLTKEELLKYEDKKTWSKFLRDITVQYSPKDFFRIIDRAAGKLGKEMEEYVEVAE